MEPRFPTSLPSKWDIESSIQLRSGGYFYFNHRDRYFHVSNLESLDHLLDRFKQDLTILSNDILESDRVIYVYPYKKEIAHAIQETLSIALHIHNIDPSAFFIFHTENSLPADEVRIFIENVLKFRGIEFAFSPSMDNKTPLMAGQTPVFKAKNVVDLGSFLGASPERYLSLNDFKVLSEAILEYAGETSDTPNKKVYLSRKHLAELRSPKIEAKSHGYVGYLDDLRMDNETVLEDFFRSKGFEVLIPEDTFDNLTEQVRYMSSVKVLASITGSALVNALFMKNNQTVVEVASELVFGYQSGDPEAATQAVINDYIFNSFIKQHTHIYVPSHRQSELVVSKLETLIDSL